MGGGLVFFFMQRAWYSHGLCRLGMSAAGANEPFSGCCYEVTDVGHCKAMVLCRLL